MTKQDRDTVRQTESLKSGLDRLPAFLSGRTPAPGGFFYGVYSQLCRRTYSARPHLVCCAAYTCRPIPLAFHASQESCQPEF